jgi:hypothetical protein
LQSPFLYHEHAFAKIADLIIVIFACKAQLSKFRPTIAGQIVKDDCHSDKNSKWKEPGLDPRATRAILNPRANALGLLKVLNECRYRQ